MNDGGTVAILGLGLIGGSLARDLAARGVRVLGHDRDPSTLRAALAVGAIAAPLDEALDGIDEADAVILALPVDVAVARLDHVARRATRAALITDVGSTKRGIVARAEALGVADRFVGAHPLAGDHRSGWAAARRGLFAGERVYLTPTAASTARPKAAAVSLWTACGALPEWIDAADHDRLLAWTSHLPQAAASALAGALERAGIARAELGAGGRDTTRLAGSSPDVWTPIVLENAELLAPALAALESTVARLRRAMVDGDAAAVRAIFSRAEAWSAAGGSR